MRFDQGPSGARCARVDARIEAPSSEQILLVAATLGKNLADAGVSDYLLWLRYPTPAAAEARVSFAPHNVAAMQAHLRLSGASLGAGLGAHFPVAGPALRDGERPQPCAATLQALASADVPWIAKAHASLGPVMVADMTEGAIPSAGPAYRGQRDRGQRYRDVNLLSGRLSLDVVGEDHLEPLRPTFAVRLRDASGQLAGAEQRATRLAAWAIARNRAAEHGDFLLYLELADGAASLSGSEILDHFELALFDPRCGHHEAASSDQADGTAGDAASGEGSGCALVGPGSPGAGDGPGLALLLVLSLLLLGSRHARHRRISRRSLVSAGGAPAHRLRPASSSSVGSRRRQREQRHRTGCPGSGAMRCDSV